MLHGHMPHQWLIDVATKQVELAIAASDRLRSAAAIITGFALAAVTELLGFLLLVAAEHPSSEPLRSAHMTYRYPGAFVYLGLFFVFLATLFSIALLTKSRTEESHLPIEVFALEATESSIAALSKHLNALKDGYREDRVKLRFAVGSLLLGLMFWFVAITGFLTQQYPF